MAAMVRLLLAAIVFHLQIGFHGTQAQWDTMCGVDRGCFATPTNCKGDACDSTLVYKKNGDSIDFQIGTKISDAQPHYVAVGFSNDNRMGDDSVTYCALLANSRVVVGISRNPATYNSPLTNQTWTQQQIRNATGQAVNGKLSCSFSQVIRPPPGSEQEIFSLDQPHYLLLAVGAPDDQGQSLHKHTVLPSVTLDAINVANSTGSSMAGEFPDYKVILAKTHGCLMLFGWWLLVASGVLFARYYKLIFTRRLCKLDLWFHLHRGVNGFAILCIATAFVCIFIVTDGVWTGKNTDDQFRLNHACLGLAAAIAGFCQPILAAFRCHKGDKKRPIFNWLHRFIGIAAFCCASAAIWMTTEFWPTLQNSGKYGIAPRALMITYWGALGFVVIGLEILITITERFSKRDVVSTEIQMHSVNGKTTETIRTTSGIKYGFIRILLYLFFLLVAIGVTVALACFIILP